MVTRTTGEAKARREGRVVWRLALATAAVWLVAWMGDARETGPGVPAGYRVVVEAVEAEATLGRQLGPRIRAVIVPERKPISRREITRHLMATGEWLDLEEAERGNGHG